MAFDPTTVTVTDFQNQFYRGFFYLPTWVNTTAYNVGTLVYYSVNDQFYTCILANTGQLPTNTTYWSPAVANKYDFVWDQDITNAFAEALTSFAQPSQMTDATANLVYLYLSAHFLVNDIRANGVSSQFNAPLSSRAVGNVSEAYKVPDWMMKPSFSFYTTTYYGFKYLIMIRPYLIGNLFVVPTPRHALETVAGLQLTLTNGG